jgi:hypothetical protein
MNRVASWLVALTVGGAVGGGTFAALVPDAALAACSALFWTLGVGLTLTRNRSVLLSTPGGARQRWSGAFGGLAALAAGLGVAPTLPVSPDLRFALGLFVIGVSLAMANVGMRMALTGGGERGVDDGRDPAGTEAATGD